MFQAAEGYASRTPALALSRYEFLAVRLIITSALRDIKKKTEQNKIKSRNVLLLW